MAGYLGASPVPQTIQKKQSFTATASQTTFTTTGYTDGAFINVYLNGVRLINGTDYTATNGSDIVLTTAASASDVLDFETFNEFTLVDQTLETPTFRTSATLKNDTHEDTDGGRESTLIFKGEQSGGEISTLAEIEASHDGTADDEKGDLIFRTNDGSDGSSPTEAVRISSNQRVGISETDPQQNLHITSATGAAIRLARNDTSLGTGDVHGSIEFHQNDPSSNGAGVVSKIQSINESTFSGHGSVAISTGTATTITERWRFTSDGHLKAAADGNGIDFSATEGSGVSSSILDDYEEGTWTATAASGLSSIGSSTANNRYTKIGNVVNVIGELFTFSGQTSDVLEIGGLPYAIGSAYESSFSVMFNNINLDSGYTQIVGYAKAGTSEMRFYELGDNIAYNVVAGSQTGAGTSMIIQMTYHTA